MTADDNTFAADAAEQGDPTENVSDETILALPDSRDEVPVADMLEQSIAVREVQILRPAGSRKEASEADWIEQSVEVPVDEEMDR
jgi:hypothetical protein